MKKYTSILALFTIVLTALVSCSKEIADPEFDDNGSGMKTVTVKTSIVTKTTLDAGHANLVWSTGDKISVFNDQNTDNLSKQYEAGADIVVSVPTTTEEIYAHYPYYKNNTTGPQNVSVYITNAQKQTNPGELNGYNYPMVAKGTVTQDNIALISFYPVASALALNIFHSGLSGDETVISVTVTPSTSNTGFTGSQTTDITVDNVVYTAGASSDPITVTLTNPLSLGSTPPANKQTFDGQIYVCLAKQSYANVKFEIETSKGKYTISSNNTPFDCVNNDFVPVNIDLAKAVFEPDLPPTDFEWNLVTSADEIVVGAEVVIAAKGAEYAMSQQQNSNNRGQAAIAKTGTKIIWEEDVPVQTFEVVAGSVNNSVAFKCTDGEQKGKYIYAASSSNNYLRSQASVDANASWTVEINSTTNAATLTAKGTNTRNLLRYNSSSACFSCYSSGQGDIVLYIKGEAADPNAKAIFSSGTIEVAATGESADYENAYSVQNIEEDTEIINVTATENIIDPSAYGGEVSFSMAPNYNSNKVTGSITLTLDEDEDVTATIPIEQNGSSLRISVADEIVIPANASSVSFTVTSPEFDWSITANNSDVTFTESGNASESPTTVTVSSEVEATSEEQTIATLTIIRNGNANDPQAKTVVVKKAASGGDSALYTATFEEDEAHRTSGNNSYTSNSYTVSNVNWTLIYADAVTSGAPLVGSANVSARVAKNTTNSPSATTDNILTASATISKITFFSKLGNNVSLALQYSTNNGSTWTTVTASKDTEVHSTYGYSAEIPNVTTSSFQLKFVWSVASSTTGNRDSQLDNVTVYGH